MKLPPEPNFDAHVEDLVAFYQNAMERINAQLQKDAIGSLSFKKRRALLREIAGILQSLNADARAWVEEFVPQAYAHGQASALVSLGEAASMAAAVDLVANIGMVNEEMVRNLVADTMDDLLAATDKVGREVKRQVRQIVAQHTRLAALTSENMRSVGKKTAADLSRISAPIIGKDGRRWDLRVYADTVVQTKLADAHREGAIEKAVAEGFDLGRISAHGATDACRNFEGAIVSLTGSTPGYRTVSELRASGLIWHPRCKHIVNPINPTLLPESEQRLADKMAPKVDEALKLADEGKMNSGGLKKSAQ